MKIKKMFNNFMNRLKTSRVSRIAFFSSVISLMLLVGITTAWFVSVVNIPNSELNVGTLSLVGKAYDKDGNFIKNLDHPYNEADLNVNDVYVDGSNIFDTKDLKADGTNLDGNPVLGANSGNTIFLSLEKAGSLDMDYNLSFVTNGTADESMAYIGGYWFKVTNISKRDLNFGLAKYGDATGSGTDFVPENGADPNLMNYVPVIQDYLTDPNNQFIPCSDKCYDINGKASHICTESTQGSHNMSEIEQFNYKSTLTSKDEVNNTFRDIIRIDFGLCKDSTSPAYTGKSIKIAGRVYSTQLGALENPNGQGHIFYVMDEVTLQMAIDNAISGDTIVLSNNVTYNGDLNINKCINLNCNGNILRVNGHFRYDFKSKKSLTIDLTSVGSSIFVNRNSSSLGGDFVINAPLSEVFINGNRGQTRFYVDGKISLNASSKYDALSTESIKKGIVFNGFNFVQDDGYSPKDIYIHTDTSLTINDDINVKNIYSVDGAKNISIYNKGQIENIDLSTMLIEDEYPGIPYDGDYPQIYILNKKMINGVVTLPRWSTKFVKTVKNVDGKEQIEYTGNTTIIRDWDASEITIANNGQQFGKEDIEDVNKSTELVIENEYLSDYTIYYHDVMGEEKNLQNILTEYFMETEGGNPTQVMGKYISRIKKLKIVTLDGKSITLDDIKFLNKGMKGLKYLDISKSFIDGNGLPNEAFLNKNKLERLILPNTLRVIGRDAILGTNIQYLSIPASVSSGLPSCISEVKFVNFEGSNDYVISDDNYFTNNYTLVPREYMTKFKNNHKKIEDRIYETALVTDDYDNAVRLLDDNTYVLAIYAGKGTDMGNKVTFTLGENLTINGNPIIVSKIGDKALYNYNSKDFDVKFANDVKEIGSKAFYSKNVLSIDFNNVITIGESAFAYSPTLTEIDTKRVSKIEDSAFSNCKYLFNANLPEVVTIANEAFFYCDDLRIVKFGAINLIEYGAFTVSNNITYNQDTERYFFFSGVTGDYINIYDKRAKFIASVDCIDRIRHSDPKNRQTERLVYEWGNRAGNKNLIKNNGPVINGTRVELVYDVGEFLVSLNENNLGKITTCNFGEINKAAYTIPDVMDYDHDNDPDTPDVLVNIESIGDYAFYEVRMHNSSDSYDCMDNLNIGGSIKNIEAYAFANINTLNPTKKFKNLGMDQLERIGAHAFENNVYLEGFRKDNKIKYLTTDCFRNCLSLTELYFPAIVNFLSLDDTPESYGVFCNCPELFKLDFGPNLENIKGNIIKQCGKINQIIIRNDTLQLADLNIFANNINYLGNNRAVKVYYPESVCNELNGGGLIYNNTKILGDFIGDYQVWTRIKNGSIKYIQLNEYCVNKNAPLSDSRGRPSGEFGLAINSVNYLTNDFPTRWEIPESFNIDGVIYPVKKINFNAFSEIRFSKFALRNEYKDNFVLPDSLQEIGFKAFYQTDVALSNFNNVKYIGSYAFNYCQKLSLIEGSKLLGTGTSVFSRCHSLQYVNFPNLMYPGNYTFDSCNNLLKLITNSVTVNGAWYPVTSLREIYVGVTEIISYGYRMAIGSYIVYTGRQNEGKVDYPNIVYIEDNATITYSGYTSYQVKAHTGDAIKELTFSNYILLKNEDGRNTVTLSQIFKRNFTDEVVNGKYTVPNSFNDVREKKYNDGFETGTRLPGVYTVTKIGDLVYSNSIFGPNVEIIIPRTINELGYHCIYGSDIRVITGLGVTKLGWDTLSYNKQLTTINLPNLPPEYTPAHNMRDNPMLSKVDLGNVSKIDLAFTGDPNLRLIENKKLFSIDNDPNRPEFDKVPKGEFVTIYISEPITNRGDFELRAESFGYEERLYLKDKIKFLVPYEDYPLYQQYIPFGYKISTYGGKETINNVTYTFEDYRDGCIIKSINTTNISINIPEILGGKKVVAIERDAFKSADLIQKVTLPKYYQYYFNGLFTGMITLSTIEVNPNNLYFATDSYGALYNKNMTELIYYPCGKGDKDGIYNVYKSTEKIRSGAFKEAKLMTVGFGVNVKVFGDDVFENADINYIIFDSVEPPFIPNDTMLDNFIKIYVSDGSLDKYLADPMFSKYDNITRRSEY